MEKTLVIVRHGNTFAPNETPTRVGAKTNIPLVEEHRGRSAGKYLLQKNIIPSKVFAAPLKRTMQTAQLIIDEMGLNMNIIPENDFTEIDYGADENKTEQEVMLRLGKQYAQENNLAITNTSELETFGKNIIEQWNSKAIVPKGWHVDVDTIVNAWKNFAEHIADNETALICTSNGIIRFAPYIMGNNAIPAFMSKYDLKVATGSVSVFKYKDSQWYCEEWNTKAYKLFSV